MHAGRQAGAVNAEVVMRTGALLLDTRSERSIHGRLVPREEAPLRNAHKQGAPGAFRDAAIF